MFAVLVGSSHERPAQMARRVLVESGFGVQVVPTAAVLPSLRATALACGRMDAVVLVVDEHNQDGQVVASQVAIEIRNLEQDLSFRGGVRVSAVPIIFTDIAVPVRELHSGTAIRSFPGGIEAVVDRVRWSSYCDVDELHVRIIDPANAGSTLGKLFNLRPRSNPHLMHRHEM